MNEPADVALKNLVAAISATITADTGYAAALAASEVERRIQSGELVEVAALQLAPGLELVPLGRLQEITDLLATIVKHQTVTRSKDKKLHALVEHAKALLGDTPPVPTPEPEPKETKRRRRPSAQIGEPVAETGEPPTPEPDPPPVDRERQRRPKDWPEEGVVHHCADHLARGEEVVVDQQKAELSFTLHRRVLCVDCLQA